MIRDKKTMRIIEITLHCVNCKRDTLFRRGVNGLACYVCGDIVKTFAGVK